MTGSHDRDDLWGALALDAAQPPVVAIVGGGGKTSLLYRLGREAEARGLRAVLGGTTRFTRDPAGRMPRMIVEREAALAERVAEALEEDAVVVAATGREPQHRLASLSDATVGALARIDGLGLLALEADGSKMRPFKAPADHEPVIPTAATHVVAVVGVDAIDAPLDEAHVHRPERVRAVLEGEGAAPGATCTVDAIARVLASSQGGRKYAGGRHFAVLVNKADRDPGGAQRLAEALRHAGVPRVVVAALRDEAQPVRAVLS